MFRSTMSFNDLNEDALMEVVKDSIGKPFHDYNEKPVGTIVSATRIEGTKHIEFVMEVYEDESGEV